jgi:serine/threonine protein kinase
MVLRINPQYVDLEGFIQAIPYIFHISGEIIHTGRNTVKVFNINGLAINVKSFKMPILLNRIVYKYFRKSKAERSYEYAHRLRSKGIDTPCPIAYIEQSKDGLYTQSYYISVHELADGTMKDIYKHSAGGNRHLIKSFTKYTASLHKKGVFHKDYSPGNILYKKTASGYMFNLVDLNRIRFKKITLFNGCKSFARIRINESMKEFIVTEYASEMNYNRHLCKILIGYYNRIFWKKHLQRHPEYVLNRVIN